MAGELAMRRWGTMIVDPLCCSFQVLVWGDFIGTGDVAVPLQRIGALMIWWLQFSPFLVSVLKDVIEYDHDLLANSMSLLSRGVHYDLLTQKI